MKKPHELTVKVTVDASEALAELRAVLDAMEAVDDDVSPGEAILRLVNRHGWSFDVAETFVDKYW